MAVPAFQRFLVEMALASPKPGEEPVARAAPPSRGDGEPAPAAHVVHDVDTKDIGNINILDHARMHEATQ